MISEKMKNSPGLRVIIIFIIILLLLIPAQMIRSLIRERESRQEETVTEIFQKWGENQQVVGPILTIPYQQRIVSDGKSSISSHYLNLLPENLEISGELVPTLRHRGIYEAVLYQADLIFTGNFDLTQLAVLAREDIIIGEENAFLSMGISDLKGIKNFPVMTWGDNKLETEPGTSRFSPLESGITIVSSDLLKETSIEFGLPLIINGSRKLEIAPLGKNTIVHLTSSWANPSFSGNFLPESYVLNTEGFKADWKVLHYNRNYPQEWSDLSHNEEISSSLFGVDLLLPVDHYQKTMRTVKYCFLFIGLTFAAFFMIELLMRKILHPLQYILIGFGLVLFYSLLLALTEHLGFNLAYLLSSIFIISLISLYSRWILRKRTVVFIIPGVMTILYGFLFILLQLQDYSLLIGSVGLLVILGLIMFLTRKIDWYDIKTED